MSIIKYTAPESATQQASWKSNDGRYVISVTKGGWENGRDVPKDEAGRDPWSIYLACPSDRSGVDVGLTLVGKDGIHAHKCHPLEALETVLSFLGAWSEALDHSYHGENVDLFPTSVMNINRVIEEAQMEVNFERALIEYAEKGADDGKNAGSYVIDGNTSVETAKAILKGYDEGDNEVMDMCPDPLSGVWSGQSMPEILGDYAESDEVQEAYTEAFQTAYWNEVLRSAEKMLIASE